jgi:hypothetical protein
MYVHSPHVILTRNSVSSLSNSLDGLIGFLGYCSELLIASLCLGTNLLSWQI